jgi:fission process protein 1
MLSAHRYVAYTSDIGESFRPIAHPYLVKGAYGISWLYLTGDVAHEGYKAYCRNQRTLHPEKFIDEAADKSLGDQKDKDMAATGKSFGSGIFDKVQDLAKNATSTEGIKYGDSSSALTGGQVVAGRIPAIEDYRAVMAQRAVFQAVASMGLPAFTIHSIVRYSGRALKDVKNKTLRTWAPIGVSHFPPCTLSSYKVLIRCSLVSQPYLSYPICSMSLSSTRLNGFSTMHSKRLEARRLSRGDR